MKQINVAVSDSVYIAAKTAAVRSGMLLRRWVEDALAAKAGIRVGIDPAEPGADETVVRYVPFEEA